MLTQFGLNEIAATFGDKIVALNYYIDGIKKTIDIKESDIQNSTLTKIVTFSGIDGVITKTELVNSNGNVIAQRQDNITLTSAKDLLVKFSFEIKEV